MLVKYCKVTPASTCVQYERRHLTSSLRTLVAQLVERFAFLTLAVQLNKFFSSTKNDCRIRNMCACLFMCVCTYIYITVIFRRHKPQGLAKLKKTKLHGLSPRPIYTDRATAACRRSDCQLLRIEGATWSA
jgi:hypothetical protein